jgi:hypothetical protein
MLYIVSKYHSKLSQDSTSFGIKIKNKKKDSVLRKVSKMAKRRGGILAVLHRIFCEKLTKFQGSTAEVVMGKSCPLNSMPLLDSYIQF